MRSKEFLSRNRSNLWVIFTVLVIDAVGCKKRGAHPEASTTRSIQESESVKAIVKKDETGCNSIVSIEAPLLWYTYSQTGSCGLTYFMNSSGNWERINWEPNAGYFDGLFVLPHEGACDMYRLKVLNGISFTISKRHYAKTGEEKAGETKRWKDEKFDVYSSIPVGDKVRLELGYYRGNPEEDDGLKVETFIQEIDFKGCH